jgi:CheY-like chemotaxis protein
LESAGYTVLAAADGVEALRLYEEQADSISIAVLDVVMPNLGGREVMDRIREKHPKMRFLFSSGYTRSAIHTNFVIKDGLRLIAKPYREADLLRAVRETLDSPA